MKIKIAKTAGFCMGVRRAVDMVLDSINSNSYPIYTYGPLIHNSQVLKLLEERGVSVLDEIPQTGKGTVLIRAHGIPPITKKNLNNAGFKVIDATCPRVINVQRIIQKYSAQAYNSIIIGDKDHPEVIGLLGYADEKGYVACDIKSLDELPIFDKAIIVAQTTQNIQLFNEVKEWAKEKFPCYKIFETICDSTQKRQYEIALLAQSVDLMVVVGGVNSGNTKRLAEIAAKTGKPVYHIETEVELDVNSLIKAESIGITAGASTPNWIINKIYRTIELSLYTQKKSWFKFFFFLQQILLRSNLYIAIGAGYLCFACNNLLDSKSYLNYIMISMLYILSIHTFNNLTGSKAYRYNDPDKAIFYDKNKMPLMIIAVLSGLFCLIIGYSLSIIDFFILLAMSIMGFFYNIEFASSKYKFQKIFDIVGSKTILISLAWGIVTCLLPSRILSNLYVDSNLYVFNNIIIFIWSTGIVFVRTSLFDVIDIQGDRIVGKETIPILLGEKKTLRLLKVILSLLIILLFLSSFFKYNSNLGFILCFCSIFLFIAISAIERGYIPPGIRMEFLIETQFILIGIATFIWFLFFKN